MRIWIQNTAGLVFMMMVSCCQDLFGVPDPDPNPDPPNPHIFEPPGSGSFYQQAEMVIKTLIPTVLWLLLDFLSLKNDVNVPSKSNKQKNFFFKLVFCWHLEGQCRKYQDPDPGSGSESGSTPKCHESGILDLLIYFHEVRLWCTLYTRGCWQKQANSHAN
jgi:hypothetical protein